MRYIIDNPDDDNAKQLAKKIQHIIFQNFEGKGFNGIGKKIKYMILRKKKHTYEKGSDDWNKYQELINKLNINRIERFGLRHNSLRMMTGIPNLDTLSILICSMVENYKQSNEMEEIEKIFFRILFTDKKIELEPLEHQDLSGEEIKFLNGLPEDNTVTNANSNANINKDIKEVTDDVNESNESNETYYSNYETFKQIMESISPGSKDDTLEEIFGDLEDRYHLLIGSNTQQGGARNFRDDSRTGFFMGFVIVICFFIAIGPGIVIGIGIGIFTLCKYLVEKYIERQEKNERMKQLAKNIENDEEEEEEEEEYEGGRLLHHRTKRIKKKTQQKIKKYNQSTLKK